MTFKIGNIFCLHYGDTSMGGMRHWFGGASGSYEGLLFRTALGGIRWKAGGDGLLGSEPSEERPWWSVRWPRLVLDTSGPKPTFEVEA